MPDYNALQKYVGDQDPRYGGKLHWPGANGYPLLGESAPLLKQHEIEALPVAGRAYERTFDLNNEQDRIDYNWVRDRIRNGLFVLDHITRKWPDDKPYPVIYLEWTQCFTLHPGQGHTPGAVNVKRKQFTLQRAAEDSAGSDVRSETGSSE